MMITFDEEFLKKFSMIFAASMNGIIGKDNKLLWHLPNDLKKFKELTKNKIVIMGRKTYVSLPNGALPGRLNVVMCNDDEDFLKEEIKIDKPNTAVVKVGSLQEVLQLVSDYQKTDLLNTFNVDEVFVIGGGVIYNLFLPFINKLYLTYVNVEIDGDTSMPPIDKYEWETIEMVENKKDDKHEYDYTFYTLTKSNYTKREINFNG